MGDKFNANDRTRHELMADAKKMTKAKARKLAQVARSRGHLVVDTYTIELFCPLSGHRGRTLHRITVARNLAWEPFTAPMIDAAFVEHYRSEYEEDRCPYADSDS